MLSDVARFNAARRYCSPLLMGGAILAGLAVGLIAGAAAPRNARWLANVLVPPWFAYLGSALLVATAGWLSAGILTVVRHRLLIAESQHHAALPKRSAPSDGQGRRRRLASALRRLRRLS
jgi:hypothetical protein